MRVGLTVTGPMQRHPQERPLALDASADVWGRLERSQAQLQTLLNVLDAAVMVLDQDQCLVAFNATAQERTERNFGVSLVAGSRLPVRSDIDREIERALAGHTLHVVHGPEQRPAEVPDYWVEVTLSPVRASDGAVIGVVYHSLDVTERMRVERALERSAAFRDALLALTPAALAAPSTDDAFQHVLALAVQHVPGAEAGTVLLRNGGDAYRFVAAVGYDRSSLQRFEVPLDGVDANRGGALVGCRRLRWERFPRSAETETLQGLLRIDAVRSSLSVPLTVAGREVGYVQLDSFSAADAFGAEASEFGVALRDLVSALVGRLELEADVRAERARSHHLAHHDPLTGLANRGLLLDRLAKALARDGRIGLRTAVVRLDLVNFKRVNEVYGHATGDGLLVAVGEALLSAVREADSVARLGSDEFAVVVAGLSSLDVVDTVARRIRTILSEPLLVGDHSVEIGCSVGIAIAPDDATSADGLFGQADLALGRSKRAGVGEIAYFTDAVDRHVRERHRLGEDLRRAIRTGEGLWTAFQPKLWMSGDERVVGVEALARWDHPELGPVSPGVFAPLAESLGLIDALSAHIFDQACAALAGWRRLGEATSWRVALNVSPLQLQGEALTVLLERLLGAHGLSFADVELEVTESVAFDADPSSIETLSALRARGAQVAIDDFGTGYASLQRLAVQPLDVLKIDRGFVSGLPASDRDSAVVDTVVALARGLGLQSVAEGVETAEQCAALRARHVDIAQGYLIARPMPAEAVLPWLQARSAQ